MVPSGIIPALAGNTGSSGSRSGFLEDHPRSRGEYTHPDYLRPAVVGSSPLSRGIRCGSSASRVWVGIIPALAGNTRYLHRLDRDRSDHPRSRGEYRTWSTRSASSSGSSPLSRGILGGQCLGFLRGRIIPALAGNTLVDKGFYQPDLSDLGNPLLARLRFSKSLAPRLRRPPSWRGGSSGSASEGPGRTIRVSPS